MVKPKKKINEARSHFGKYIWVYMSLGLFLMLFLPEIDPSNSKPIYITTEHFNLGGHYKHTIRIKYINKRQLQLHLAKYDYAIKQSHIQIQFVSDNEEEFFPVMENIIEDLFDVTHNIKFVKSEDFHYAGY